MAIVAITILYGLSSSRKILPTHLCPLIILAVSIALVFHTSLISKYFVGGDVHLENYVFRLTEAKGVWSPPHLGISSETARFESVLSITILPTIFSNVLNASGELILKIIYPLVFCLVPLVLYRLYETQVGKYAALLSVFFFVSIKESYFGPEPLSLGRQMIGSLFFVLSIYLLLEKTISTQKKQILFILFGAALVVSHYALSYFYVLLIILTFLFLRKWRDGGLLSTVSVLLIFAITFSWYIYVSDAPLLKLDRDIQRISENFATDILSPQARSAQAETLVSAPTSMVSLVHRFVFLVQNLFIAIGVAGLVLKRKKTEIDPSYRLISVLCFFVLVACILVPYLAASFQLTRFYAITITFLAPCFVLGGEITFDLAENALASVSRVFPIAPRFGPISKSLSLKLVSLFLIVSFLFSVGFIDHITGNYPDSLSLDGDRKRTHSDLGIRTLYYYMIIPDQDVLSALWLSKHTNSALNTTSTLLIYADQDPFYHVLNSYGLIPLNRIHPLFTYSWEQHQGYIYLRYLNVADDVLVTSSPLNASAFSSSLNAADRIYSNGASEVYSSYDH
jgi:uncharacterized membrane protein